MSIQVTFAADGQVARVSLARPPRNILDAEMLFELGRKATGLASPEHRRLKGILLTSEGASFSYGASIEEHDRARAPTMLEAFHAAIVGLMAPGVPIVASVRGQCLGAGLELACLASHIVAHVDAHLGQPEIRLGAIAPLAAVLLPERIGQRHADELLLSGRTVDAGEALRIGLVDALAPSDPELEALGWIRSCLLPHSASSLRLAHRAARGAVHAQIAARLPGLFRMYREELLPTADAEEGVRAFLERRAPRWVDG
jgi:cyclohexa-1,5-dienecarbonyl-CoA hydratase